eukprot:Awhi_evm1s11235
MTTTNTRRGGRKSKSNATAAAEVESESEAEDKENQSQSSNVGTGKNPRKGLGSRKNSKTTPKSKQSLGDKVTTE